MKKTYKSKLSLNGIIVRAHNKVVSVCLEPDIINEFGLWGSSYTTDDVEIQKAIESHTLFNGTGRDSIWTDDTEEPNEEVKQEEEDVKVSLRRKKKVQ